MTMCILSDRLMSMKTNEKRLDDCINRIKDCKTLESISKIDVYEERRFLLNYLPTITSNELGKKSIIRNIHFLLDKIGFPLALTRTVPRKSLVVTLTLPAKFWVDMAKWLKLLHFSLEF